MGEKKLSSLLLFPAFSSAPLKNIYRFCFRFHALLLNGVLQRFAAFSIMVILNLIFKRGKKPVRKMKDYKYCPWILIIYFCVFNAKLHGRKRAFRIRTLIDKSEDSRDFPVVGFHFAPSPWILNNGGRFQCHNGINMEIDPQRYCKTVLHRWGLMDVLLF